MQRVLSVSMSSAYYDLSAFFQEFEFFRMYVLKICEKLTTITPHDTRSSTHKLNNFMWISFRLSKSWTTRRKKAYWVLLLSTKCFWFLSNINSNHMEEAEWIKLLISLSIRAKITNQQIFFTPFTNFFNFQDNKHPKNI
jgi:hypothetical protein